GAGKKEHELRKWGSGKVQGGAPDRKKSGKLPPIRQTVFKSTPNEISINLLNKNGNSGYDPHLTGQQCCCVASGQDHPMFAAIDAVEETHTFLGAQDDR